MNPVCPPDESFLAAFREKGNLKAKEELITHIRHCPRCRLKFGVLLQVRTYLQANESFRDTVPSILKRPLLYAASAIGFAIVIIGGTFFLLRDVQDRSYRGGADKLALIEPSGRLSHPPSVFAWSPIKNTDHYMLELVDDGLMKILTVDTKRTRIVLSEEERAKLKKGTTYIWTVRAIDEESRLLDSLSGSFAYE